MVRVSLFFLSFLISSYGQAVKIHEIDCVYPYSIVYKKMANGHWLGGIHVVCFDSGQKQSEPIYFALQSKVTEEDANTIKAKKFLTQLGTYNHVLGDMSPTSFTVEKDLGPEYWRTVNYIVCVPYGRLDSFITLHRELIHFTPEYGSLKIIDYRAIADATPQAVLGAYTGVHSKAKLKTIFEGEHYNKERVLLTADVNSIIKALALLMENRSRGQSNGIHFALAYEGQPKVLVDHVERMINYIDLNQVEADLPASLRTLCKKYHDACYERESTEDTKNAFLDSFVEGFLKAYKGKDFHVFASRERSGDITLCIMRSVKNLEGSGCTFFEDGAIEGWQEGKNGEDLLEHIRSFSFLLADEDLDYDSSDSGD